MICNKFCFNFSTVNLTFFWVKQNNFWSHLVCSSLRLALICSFRLCSCLLVDIVLNSCSTSAFDLHKLPVFCNLSSSFCLPFCCLMILCSFRAALSFCALSFTENISFFLSLSNFTDLPASTRAVSISFFWSVGLLLSSHSTVLLFCAVILLEKYSVFACGATLIKRSNCAKSLSLTILVWGTEEVSF